MPKILASTYQKGGVGKTTLAYHLAHGLPGRKLVVELDPQRNLSTLFGIQPQEFSSFDFFEKDMDWEKSTVAVAEDIAFAPAHYHNYDFDLHIQAEERPQRMQNFHDNLRNFPGEWVLIDCAPDQNTATTAAQWASDLLLIPVRCELASIPGLADMLNFLHQMEIETPFLLAPNCLDKREALGKQVDQKLREQFPSQVLTSIPNSVSIKEIWATLAPAWLSKGSGGKAMKNFVSEVQAWQLA